MGVLVTHVKEHINKRGDKMAFCQIEDLTGAGECVFFADEYAKYKELLKTDQPLEVEAKLSRRQDSYTPPPAGGNNGGDAAPESGAFAAPVEDEAEDAAGKVVKLVATALRPLRDACESSLEPVNIELPADCFDPDRLDSLSEILKRYPGEAPVRLRFSEGHLEYLLNLPRHKVSWQHDLAKELDTWCAAGGGGPQGDNPL